MRDCARALSVKVRHAALTAKDADSTVLLQYEGGLTVLLMPSWNWPVNRKDIIVKSYDLASLENNMIVVEILDAAIRSAKSGKAIFF